MLQIHKRRRKSAAAVTADSAVKRAQYELINVQRLHLGSSTANQHAFLHGPQWKPIPRAFTTPALVYSLHNETANPPEDAACCALLVSPLRAAAAPPAAPAAALPAGFKAKIGQSFEVLRWGAFPLQRRIFWKERAWELQSGRLQLLLDPALRSVTLCGTAALLLNYDQFATARQQRQRWRPPYRIPMPCCRPTFLQC